MSSTAMDEDKGLDFAARAVEASTEETVALPELPEIPDGGLRAWLCVLGGWLVTFCTFGYSNSFGVYQDYYTLVGASTSSDISWIGSIQLFLTFLLSVFAGRWFDAGYFRAITITGSLIFCFCIFMLSLANPEKYYQLVLSQGVGLGIGSGLLLVPSQSVQTHHWKQRRALALGIVVTGTGVGGIVYPVMLNRLIHGRAGFAWGVRATAFLTLGMLVIANFMMTTRPSNVKRRQPPMKPTLRRILTDFAYLLFVGGNFLTLWGVYFPYFYLQLWVNLHGLSNTLAFYSIAILNAASIPGRVVLNMLADQFGTLNVLCPTTFITGVLVFAMFGVSSDAAVIVFSILYGFFSGAYIALLAPTIATLADDVNEIGLRLGLAYSLTSFAFLTGTPVTGALLGAAHSWYQPILFSAIVVVMGSIVIGVSRQMYIRKKDTQRL